MLKVNLFVVVLFVSLAFLFGKDPKTWKAKAVCTDGSVKIITATEGEFNKENFQVNRFLITDPKPKEGEDRFLNARDIVSINTIGLVNDEGLLDTSPEHQFTFVHGNEY